MIFTVYLRCGAGYSEIYTEYHLSGFCTAAAAGTLQHTKPNSARNLVYFFICSSTDITSHKSLKELPSTSKQA